MHAARAGTLACMQQGRQADMHSRMQPGRHACACARRLAGMHAYMRAGTQRSGTLRCKSCPRNRFKPGPNRDAALLPGGLAGCAARRANLLARSSLAWCGRCRAGLAQGVGPRPHRGGNAACAAASGLTSRRRCNPRVASAGCSEGWSCQSSRAELNHNGTAARAAGGDARAGNRLCCRLLRRLRAAEQKSCTQSPGAWSENALRYTPSDG